MICTKPLVEQLLEIAELRDGWLDGEGITISNLTLMEAGRRVREHLGQGKPLPYLYPKPDGGISVEWDEDGGGHFTIEHIAPLISAAEARVIWRQMREEREED